MALGIAHPALGQAIVLVAQPSSAGLANSDSAASAALLAACREHLPGFMMPTCVQWLDQPLPRNANGKIDRKRLATERAELFDSFRHEAAA